MKTLIRHLLIVFMLASPVLASAIEAEKVPENKRTSLGLYLTAREASVLKAAQGHAVLFVDVRSRAEATFLGMARDVDVLIPYQDFNGETAPWDAKASTYGLEANLDFLPMLEKAMQARKLGKDSPILLMCRSGARSATAATLLARYGYSKVYSVVDGYEGDVAKDGPRAGQRAINGWRVEGLPWSYKLSADKVPQQ
jgi:rhodanese-related sulfurtransferase